MPMYLAQFSPRYVWIKTARKKHRISLIFRKHRAWKINKKKILGNVGICCFLFLILVWIALKSKLDMLNNILFCFFNCKSWLSSILCVWSFFDILEIVYHGLYKRDNSVTMQKRKKIEFEYINKMKILSKCTKLTKTQLCSFI